MTQTALDFIQQAASKVGGIAIGETLDADEAMDYFHDLNDILDIFNINKLNVFHTLDYNGFFVPGQGDYVIGPGQQFDSVRPVGIQNIYYINSKVSYPVAMITNNQYDDIALKELQTAFPEVCYYETSYPYGIFHFYPVPTIANQVVISYDDQFAQLNTLNQFIAVPPGYSLLLKMELALLISTKLGVDFSNENAKILAEARNAVKTTNHTPLYTENDPRLDRSNKASFTFIYSGGFG